MKKLIVALVAIVMFSASALAQAGSEKYAIGARIGDGWAGLGVEVSGMIGVGPNLNRLEIDLGWNRYHYPVGAGYSDWGHFLYATCTYQWRWNIIKGLHWYVGPGVCVGTRIWHDAYNDARIRFDMGIGGQVGIEYDFDAPIQLTLDYRPMFNFFGHSGPTYFDCAAFGVRYRF